MLLPSCNIIILPSAISYHSFAQEHFIGVALIIIFFKLCRPIKQHDMCLVLY